MSSPLETCEPEDLVSDPFTWYQSLHTRIVGPLPDQSICVDQEHSNKNPEQIRMQLNHLYDAH